MHESRDSDAMELWDEEQEEWIPTRFDYGELLSDKENAYEPTVVIHPFSHRQFRATAQKLVIPPMVLDLMMKGKDCDLSLSSDPNARPKWKPTPAPTESSRGTAINRDRSTTTKSETASTWTGKMGGVRGPAPSMPALPSCGTSASFSIGRGGGGGVVGRVGGTTSSGRPRISGRGRALRMRAERGGALLRKPGRLVGEPL